MEKDYYVYILTNPSKTVLYIGVTNDLEQRVMEHYLNRGDRKPFAGRYSCYFLIYYEVYNIIQEAISREKQLKKWNRGKKEALIRTKNPGFEFLNIKLFGCWPPPGLWGPRCED